MTALYIIKTGSTFKTLAAEQGDFEDWIKRGLEQDELEVRVINAERREPLPHPDTCAGIVITGSQAMVTDREPWSEAVAAWLPTVIAAGVPVLGICYGHQLLAHAMGGGVGYHPHGKETGTVPVFLTAAADSDPLLAGLPKTFVAHTTHSQTVLSLPDGAVLLAGNDFEPHHAYRVGKAAWGIQFHPEFDAAIMREYIRQQAEAPGGDHRSLEQRLKEVTGTPVAAAVLRRFASIAARGPEQK